VKKTISGNNDSYMRQNASHSDVRLFFKNKQANLKNKPKTVILTEKQAQRAFGRKVQNNVKPAG